MASAPLHASRVECGRGCPVASMAHPPKLYDLISSWKSGDFSDTISKTFTASATTSGPTKYIRRWKQDCEYHHTYSISWKDRNSETMICSDFQVNKDQRWHIRSGH